MTKFTLTPHNITPYAQYAITQILLEYNAKGIDIEDAHEFGWVMCNRLTEQDDVQSYGYQQPLPKSLKIALKQINQTFTALPTEPTDAYVQTYANLRHLTGLLKFSEAEYEVLRFMVHASLENALRQTLGALRINSLRECHEIIAKVTSIPISQVRRVCNRHHLLVKLDILDISYYRSHDRFFEFLHMGDTLGFDQLTEHPLDNNWLKRATSDSEPTKLTLKDFDYLGKKLTLLTDYLNHVKTTKQKGVNILIHGLAGTGKTQLASLLAKHTGHTARTITTKDENSEAIDVRIRLSGYYMANIMYENDNETLLIFDEVEHIFNDSTMFEPSFATRHKAWINELLETNHKPSIWIGNNIADMDEAFIRRFDIVLKMPDMPFNKKRELITSLADAPIKEGYLDRFCQNANLTPAVIERGLKVATSVYKDTDDISQTAFELFNETLTAQGHRPMPKVQDDKPYRLSWINTTQDLQKITENLTHTKNARICCYGSAGTGKTEWANHLAKATGQPALTVRASDLLGGLVGETEQNIANAFNKARDLNMTLIIDEVDSFLFDRTHASHSWEQTMVNEMLTQIENFDGLLVVSTNMMKDLDKAVLRRFDIKIEFKYLNAHQLNEIAQYYFDTLNLTATDDDFITLKKLDNLGMGDFVSVSRQHRFSPFSSAQSFVNALAEESRLKQGNQQRIGF